MPVLRLSCPSRATVETWWCTKARSPRETTLGLLKGNNIFTWFLTMGSYLWSILHFCQQIPSHATHWNFMTAMRCWTVCIVFAATNTDWKKIYGIFSMHMVVLGPALEGFTLALSWDKLDNNRTGEEKQMCTMCVQLNFGCITVMTPSWITNSKWPTKLEENQRRLTRVNMCSSWVKAVRKLQSVAADGEPQLQLNLTWSVHTYKFVYWIGESHMVED